MGAEEQRSSQRASFNVRAEVFFEGAVSPCLVRNLSAGGALVETPLDLAEGTEFTLGLRLVDDLREAAGLDYVSFHLEVLGREEAPSLTGSGSTRYRCKNLTSPGSELYQRAVALVTEAQRSSMPAAD